MGTFFAYLILAPLSAAVFGFGVWLIPAILFRNAVARLNLRPFAFFVTGYAFIGLMSFYLLVVGATRHVGGPGGPLHRDHQIAPFAGTVASLGLVWAGRRWWRRRRPRPPRGPSGRQPQPGWLPGARQAPPGQPSTHYPPPGQPIPGFPWAAPPPRPNPPNPPTPPAPGPGWPNPVDPPPPGDGSGDPSG
jgi:hypothetical protein